jgi:hypothetical protein
MRLGVTSAITGLALVLATTGPVLAQEQPAPNEPYQGDTAGLTLPPGENNVIEVPPSSFATDAAGAFAGPNPGNGVSGIGHASDSSNNTMGDIADGLSNQNVTRDQ